MTARQQISDLAAAQTVLKTQAQEAIAASERRSADLARQLAAAASQTGAAAERIDLVDFKVNKPEPFFGRRDESWKSWSRQFKTYCNVRKDGFKKALEWAERQSVPIDNSHIDNMGY